MVVNILLVTHDNIGQAMLDVLTQTLGELPLPVYQLSVSNQTKPDIIREDIRVLIKQLTCQQDLLILTDIFGATPSNCVLDCVLACCEQTHIKVVSGLNFPMLLRTMNYAHLDLVALADKALNGGREGILFCEQRASHDCQTS